MKRINTDKRKNVGTLVRIIPERYDKTLQKEEKTTLGYYISSKTDNAGFFNALVRPYWGIEKSSASCRTLLWGKTLQERE
ncbi:hypothetical protein Barb4_01822 [Bacteroidales bacterium Barb4]|nr:hypothetical protein Barb4_01822 [Bacteroidales bacterium Barb4]